MPDSVFYKSETHYAINISIAIEITRNDSEGVKVINSICGLFFKMRWGIVWDIVISLKGHFLIN